MSAGVLWLVPLVRPAEPENNLSSNRIAVVAGAVQDPATPGGAPQEPRVIADLALELRPIPAGMFLMGSPANEAGRNSDEGPQTAVTMRAFWLGKTEVTQAQWQAVMGSNPSRFKGDSLPVEMVTWNDAMEFCRKLTQRERGAGRLAPGYEYTLPTEAQWEYACRAGSSGADPGELPATAWFRGNSGRVTHPVGGKRRNAWGLFDMNGNVAEWCAWYVGQLPGGKVEEPVGASMGRLRVVRGGSYSGDELGCRAAFRLRAPAENRSSTLGFRVALVASGNERAHR